MIFIPGQVPALKNSKVKTSRGIFHSKTVSKFIRSLGIQAFSSSKKTVKGYVDPTKPNYFELIRKEFEQMKVGKENPLIIGYHQVRRDKRAFDFSNSVELIQDLLTANDLIEDDNVRYVFPVPMSKCGNLIDQNDPRKYPLYSIDKDCPGVYIKVF